jgi:hypothetical protein
VVFFPLKYIMGAPANSDSGFSSGRNFVKSGHFFLFYLFLVENGYLKKCFPGFLVTRFQKRNLISIFL